MRGSESLAKLVCAGADGGIEHLTSLLASQESETDLAMQILVGTGDIASAEPDADLVGLTSSVGIAHHFANPTAGRLRSA